MNALPMWVQILQVVLTLFIALVAGYVGLQQWRGSELKLRMDRYPQRLLVYQAVVDFIGAVGSAGKITVADLHDLRRRTAEAHFLFGNSISAYIDELVRHGTDLSSARDEYRDRTQPHPPGYDPIKVLGKIRAEEAWFNEQPGAARAAFEKFMTIK